MLIKKIYIHSIWIQKAKIHNKIKTLPIYIEYIDVIAINFFLRKQNHCNIVPLNYSSIITYNIYSTIKTKHLFLFTLYLIYIKLWKILNFFSYKFHILKKKTTKFTILRAPCNDKNSKEQYGWNIYTSKITGQIAYNKNKYYNKYIILFCMNSITNHSNSDSKLTYTLKQ